MNNAILLGRITKQPELKHTQSGKPYCRFTLAVDRGNNTADFIPCVTWGETARNMAKYVQKGRQLLVQGKLQSGRYQDTDGTTRYTLDLFAYYVEFLAKPREHQQNREPDFHTVEDEDFPF